MSLVIRTGVDLVELAEMKRRVERSSNDLLNAFLTPQERQDVGTRVDRAGTRWAAKEATMKALGAGLGTIDPRDIEVMKTSDVPTLQLHGSARDHADRLGLTEWSVSLSHTDNYAIASVVAIGESNA